MVFCIGCISESAQAERSAREPFEWTDGAPPPVQKCESIQRTEAFCPLLEILVAAPFGRAVGRADRMPGDISHCSSIVVAICVRLHGRTVVCCFSSSPLPLSGQPGYQ